MKPLSQKSLFMIDELIRALDFEIKTGKKVSLEIKQGEFDMEKFAKRKIVYVNNLIAGEILDEVDQFI